jgi:hypothetical protein
MKLHLTHRDPKCWHVVYAGSHWIQPKLNAEARNITLNTAYQLKSCTKADANVQIQIAYTPRWQMLLNQLIVAPRWTRIPSCSCCKHHIVAMYAVHKAKTNLSEGNTNWHHDDQTWINSTQFHGTTHCLTAVFAKLFGIPQLIEWYCLLLATVCMDSQGMCGHDCENVTTMWCYVRSMLMSHVFVDSACLTIPHLPDASVILNGTTGLQPLLNSPGRVSDLWPDVPKQ